MQILFLGQTSKRDKFLGMMFKGSSNKNDSYFRVTIRTDNFHCMKYLLKSIINKPADGFIHLY
jgi:hypothetical protein